MVASTPLWPESLRTVAPWLLATTAALVACVILSMFIDTLHLSMRRGEALRLALAQMDTSRPAIDNRTTQILDNLVATSR